MSKITFRADDDLVSRLEARGESKSEIMREALRSYLDGDEATRTESSGVDDVIADRVGDIVDERLEATLDDRIAAALDERLGAPGGSPRGRQPAYTDDSGRDVNVNVSLDGLGDDGESSATVSERLGRTEDESVEPMDGAADRTASCDHCGETMPDDNVYCPNCGEKRSHRVFCECGDELQSDWSFCPGCGRRTPAADVLDTR